MSSSPFKRPLTALINTIQDGRFLKLVFLGILGLSVGTVLQDYSQMVANAPTAIPGTTQTKPLPIELPIPGDQTRPYLPSTMPLGPDRAAPRLPGYFGPMDSPTLAGDMQFALGEGDLVSALGTITPGTAKRFAAFLKDHDRQIGEIHLHSPGGSVADALAMSRLIRREGIRTHVPENGYCASSCPLVLAGGLYRSAGKHPFIGVHQIYALPPASGSLQRGMADAQLTTAAVQQLLDEMDVDIRVWTHALATPPQSLYVFTDEELVRFRLANQKKVVVLPKIRPN